MWCIPEGFKRRHAAVSGTWGRFLEFIEQHPELAIPLDASAIQYRYPLQAWPTFISPKRREQIAAATTGMFRVLKLIPTRIFGGDPARIGAYYKLPAGLMAHLLSAPDGLDCAIGRCDFLDGDSGFKCVELNPYGNLGGLDTELVAPAYLQQSTALSRFVAATGTQLRMDRLMLALFEHFAREARKLGAARDEINVAAVVDAQEFHFDASTSSYAPLYAEALARVDPALRGKIICCPVAAIENRYGTLYHADARLHAVWELSIAERCPERLYFPFKYRRVAYFNSPLAFCLGDKRNLSLLSQHADAPYFTDEERALIHRHVPWSRNVEDVETRYGGQSGPLLGIVRRHRERLVLKKGFGMGGEQVLLGPCTPADQWDDTLRIALAENDWLVQEYIEPRSYLYQHGELGAAPFHGVWGTFCFGETFAGAYLRLMPDSRAGPINSARGAMTGLVFVAP